MDSDLWGNAWSDTSKKDAIVSDKEDIKETWKPALSSAVPPPIWTQDEIPQWQAPSSFSLSEPSWGDPEPSIPISPTHHVDDTSTPKEEKEPIEEAPASDLNHYEPEFVISVPPQEEPLSFATDTESTWNALGNATVTVGDEASWNTAWTPVIDATKEEEDPDQQPDEWDQAIQAKSRREAKMPVEMMTSILDRFDELCHSLWPDIDSEDARSHPRPRSEWEGGLENVEGLNALINRYIPAGLTQSPIHFSSTKTAVAMQKSLKMTDAYGVARRSPLSGLAKASAAWELALKQEVNRKASSMRVVTDAVVTEESVVQTESSKISGLLARFSRGTTEPPRSTTPTLGGQDSSQKATAIPAHVQSAGTASVPPSPSAMSRFFTRISKPRPEDSTWSNNNGRYSDMGLFHDDEDDELPMHEEVLGPQVIFNDTKSTTKLGQMTSNEFDDLLNAQIVEKAEETLIDALIGPSAEVSSSYAPLVGAPPKKAATLRKPMVQTSPPAKPKTQTDLFSSQKSNSLFDDDEFGLFSKPSVPAPAPISKPTPFVPQPPRATSPPVLPISTTPVYQLKGPPGRSSTVAIMAQNVANQRTAIPLLPRPPGRPLSITAAPTGKPPAAVDNLFEFEAAPISQPTRSSTPATPRVQSPQPTQNSGLSAQDLSFFEGL